MKKILVCLTFISVTFAKAQTGNVGISTSTPKQNLSLGDDDSGLQENAENVLSIVTSGQNRIKIMDNGFIGINNENPTRILDLNTENDFLKLQNPKDYTAATQDFLVYNPATGEINKTTIKNYAGQVLRVPLVSNNYPVSGSDYFVSFNTAGNAIPSPVGLGTFPNYTNTISDDFTTFPVTVNSGNITGFLPGTYKITLRFAGTFLNGSDNQRIDMGMEYSTNGTTWVDYSYNEGIISNWSNSATKTGYYRDVIKFTGAVNFIRFKFKVYDNQFNMDGAPSNLYRNVLIIERL
ncbi:hypothetical protein N0B16_02155 [Chryseobacterium sp. GMJ5]|uniref:Uncharacterized protein n=1 Tax=Chryseobacterium gilvum TaxID=2976534 RepID=A0ABT2VTA5_9FLAO|nr:hypothetical protein [Chryseobacterium gilvum]MCU7613226.1 hypothetical protein [Chryseobacterium gilvum]